MAKVLIEVDVAYPHLFYKTLESQASVRQSVGEQGCLFRGVDENVHNRTFVVLDWSSALSCIEKSYVKSKGLRLLLRKTPRFQDLSDKTIPLIMQ